MEVVLNNHGISVGSDFAVIHKAPPTVRALVWILDLIHSSDAVPIADFPEDMCRGVIMFIGDLNIGIGWHAKPLDAYIEAAEPHLK